ncbi:DUF4253 domain-containing protein [Gilvimarinus polysaccharolyticus]|uniref:DUF4253 domain-containing protein n=1 Tax=Gilvimarinus polysaccharolyticus TaxID=863921 RepID=UPI000673BAA8|nr:DUF4253 domain-containing protein [Gilvimarinus polysaccharolyticus]
MNKFDIIKEKETNGANYDLSPDDIIDRLTAWDSMYGVSIDNIDHNRCEVTFDSLPDDLEAFASEIYSFCPDIVDQGYGCIDEMIEMMEESGQPIPEKIMDQIEGVDLSEEDYGLKVLQNVIRKEKRLGFWWD